MDSDSSSKFISSLTKFLQSLCNGYVEFNRGVELVGHIYLNIDTGEKVDYILHEKVNKNDENSVTFVSNSFHAQPQDKSGPAKEAPSRKDDRVSDDDDIVIVDQTRDMPGSTNYGTLPSRSMKQTSNVDRRADSSNPQSSSQRNRQQVGRPSATVTSQGSQENINIGEVKLEQISSDELMSLASQVDGGESGSNFPDGQNQPGGPGRIGQRSFSDTAGQPVWIKQEPSEGGPDTGWTQSMDGQSDSSNSSSNIYPMMMHQNPGFHSSPVFPGFSSASSSQGFPRSRFGRSGTSAPYANPMPGTSQSMDPAEIFLGRDIQEFRIRVGLNDTDDFREKTRQYKRQYRQRVKENPEWLRLYRERQRLANKKYKEKRKMSLQLKKRQ